MEATATDIVLGVSTLVMLSLGYVLGIKTIAIWREKGNNMILITALLFFSIPTPWLASGLSLTLAAFGINFNYTVGVYLIAWSVPAIAVFWLFITSSLYSREWVRYVFLVITVIPALVFMYRIYFKADFNIEAVPDSIASNIVYADIPNFVIILSGVLGLLVVFPSYLYISLKTQNKLVKFKSQAIYVAVLLFTIVGVGDGLITFESITPLLIFRFLLMVSLSLIYIGYNTPDWVKSRYTGEESNWSSR